MPKPVKLETVNIPAVEILAEGTWNGNPYTRDDFDAMVVAFDDLRGKLDPPVKLGHDGDQAIAQSDGYPAVGWVERLYRKGGKLIADFRDVPKRVADLVSAGAYQHVSSEIYFDKKIAGKMYHAILKGVALLGGDMPAVKDISSIGDIEGLYSALLDPADANFAVYLYSPDQERDEQGKWTSGGGGGGEEKGGAPRVPGEIDTSQFSKSETTQLRSDFVGNELDEEAEDPGKWSAWDSWAKDGGLDNPNQGEAAAKALEKDNDKPATSYLGRIFDGNWEKGQHPYFTDTADVRAWVDESKDYSAKNSLATNHFRTWMKERGLEDARNEELTLAAGLRSYMTKMEGHIARRPGARALRLFLSEALARLDTMQSRRKKEGTEVDLKRLIETLGMPADSTEEQVTAKIAELGTAAKEPPPDEVKELREKVVVLEKDKATHLAEQEVDAAVQEGKFTPTQRPALVTLALSDHDAFVALVASSPKLHILSEPIGSDGSPPDGAQLTDLEVEIAKKVGVTPAVLELGKQPIQTLIDKQKDEQAVAARAG